MISVISYQFEKNSSEAAVRGGSIAWTPVLHADRSADAFVVHGGEEDSHKRVHAYNLLVAVEQVEGQLSRDIGRQRRDLGVDDMLPHRADRCAEVFCDSTGKYRWEGGNPSSGTTRRAPR